MATKKRAIRSYDPERFLLASAMFGTMPHAIAEYHGMPLSQVEEYARIAVAQGIWVDDRLEHEWLNPGLSGFLHFQMDVSVIEGLFSPRRALRKSGEGSPGTGVHEAAVSLTASTTSCVVSLDLVI